MRLLILAVIILAIVFAFTQWLIFKKIGRARKNKTNGIQCPKCGSDNSVDATFCRGCGKKLESAQRDIRQH